MRNIITLLLFTFNLSFSQVSNSAFITYEEKLVVDETKFTTVVNAYLISNGSESLYEEDFTKTSNFSHKVEDNSKNYIIPSEANPLYYKNASNLITYYDFINYGTDFYVNDKIEFEWTITRKH